MLWLLLACTGEPEPAPQANAEPAPQSQPEPPPAFDAWPEQPALIPLPSELLTRLESQGIATHCAKHAAEIEYKTAVSVERIAAGRTGAEIGAFLVELPAQDTPVLLARLDRIEAGLSVLAPDSPAIAEVRGLRKLLEVDPDPKRLSPHLDHLHIQLLASLEPYSESTWLPVLLAGAWIQAYQLIAAALDDAGTPEYGHAWFYRPQVGAYFQAYVATMRSENSLPAAMLDPIQTALVDLRDRTQADPMSPEDIKIVREELAGILGML